MRLGWLAVPLLMAGPACDPVRTYQEAAHSLRFTLDRVEPRLQVAFPLDRSRLTFDLMLGVDNPSTVPFHVQSFQGDLRLESGGAVHPLGRLELVRELELPAQGQAQLAVQLAFTYQDLKEHWGPIQDALHGKIPGAWKLEGALRGQAYGLPVKLPVTARREFAVRP
jgi:hypothetical protein